MKRFPAWLGIYAALLLVDIIGSIADMPATHLYCKPLFLPMLFWGLWQNRKPIASTPWKWVMAGLFLSWVGDILLLFEQKDALFFMGGLVSFLLAHICYIIYYFSAGASLKMGVKKYPFYLLLIVVYTSGLMALLWPKLGGLLIPVAAYSVVLTFMLISSIASVGAVTKKASALLVSGAIFFVLSDSSLAINKFYHSFPLAGVVIMLTYGLAQGLITMGTIKNKKE